MRKVAYALNIAMIGFVIYNLAKSGIPKANDVWIVLLISLTPIANLFAIHIQPNPTGRSWFGKTWLGLFLERKRLEEERRIQNIRSGSDA